MCQKHYPSEFSSQLESVVMEMYVNTVDASALSKTKISLKCNNTFDVLISSGAGIWFEKVQSYYIKDPMVKSNNEIYYSVVRDFSAVFTLRTFDRGYVSLQEPIDAMEEEFEFNYDARPLKFRMVGTTKYNPTVEIMDVGAGLDGLLNVEFETNGDLPYLSYLFFHRIWFRRQKEVITCL